MRQLHRVARSRAAAGVVKRRLDSSCSERSKLGGSFNAWASSCPAVPAGCSVSCLQGRQSARPAAAFSPWCDTTSRASPFTLRIHLMPLCTAFCCSRLLCTILLLHPPLPPFIPRTDRKGMNPTTVLQESQIWVEAE